MSESSPTIFFELAYNRAAGLQSNAMRASIGSFAAKGYSDSDCPSGVLAARQSVLAHSGCQRTRRSIYDTMCVTAHRAGGTVSKCSSERRTCRRNCALGPHSTCHPAWASSCAIQTAAEQT